MSQQQQPQPLPLPDLASTYQELYRARILADAQAGITTPFVVPFHLLAYWIVPTLYLALPHRGRPWLYRARWLVLAFVCVFNWHMVRHVTSPNFAVSYGVGLVAAWTTIWSFTLLVWTRPQWDAKRVERRRRVEPEPKCNGPTNVTQARTDENDKVDGVRSRAAHARLCVAAIENTKDAEDTADIAPAMAELRRLAQVQEYEYYWQAFPADASFRTRLGWAFDIVSSFRLTGWNWAPSCLPPYEPPPRIGPYQLPLQYGQHKTRQGYERTLSRRDYIISRWLFNFVPGYIVVDLCGTLMTADPYFIVGPEHNYPLPAHLASLHPITLSLQRTMLAFVAIYFALQYAWYFGTIWLALCGPPVLGFRAHPWHLPSLTGSFTQVLDHGLSGFWGAWWHQTFRVGFSAPTKWLQRHGYLPLSRQGPKKIMTLFAGAIIAFAQSGVIHGAGSYTSASAATRCLHPPLFFMLSGLGTILQSVLSHLLRHRIEKCPRWLRRLGNLAFTVLWLWATGWALLDDFGRSGLWLWEPVPISFARAAGLGVDRRVWRFDEFSLPRWQWGSRGRWWETGIVI
ncbi:hypothetical protein F4802DRAFT_604398 [Xylaria palmicola]|nr:hypothetical protein F4802DRAFT_604398 [Xylaria palmicola]